MKTKTVALIILFMVLAGCGSGSGTAAHRPQSTPRRELTESEKMQFVTPTIYYISDYADAPATCAEYGQLLVQTSKMKIQTLQVCKNVSKGCLMQGSCYIQLNGQKTLINYHSKRVFRPVDTSICPYGLGDSSDETQVMKTMCLDPFHSVAADFSIYKLGDVIYLPAVAGVVLPDGTIHDGYFVVRDSGSGINGRGRFDFFTGHSKLGAANVFSSLGLGGESNLQYAVVSEQDASRIRERYKLHFFRFC